MVSLPTLLYRYGAPPKKPASIPYDISAEDFWEMKREEVWRGLSASMKAVYTWPIPGTPKPSTTNSSTIVYQGEEVNPIPLRMQLDTFEISMHRDSALDLKENRGRRNEEDYQVYCEAFNQFCLLVMKPSTVDHLEQSAINPPSRTIYTNHKGEWKRVEVYP